MRLDADTAEDLARLLAWLPRGVLDRVAGVALTVVDQLHEDAA